MKPGQQMQYEADEIKQWKKLIYGQHWTNNKVDEWVSSGQDTRKSGRRRVSNKSTSNKSHNDSFSSSSYSQDDWLHSPGTAKRTYRTKTDGRKW